MFTAFTLLMAAGLLMITLFWSAIEGHPALILAFMCLVGLGTGPGRRSGRSSPLLSTALRNTAVGSIFDLARGVQFFAPLIITAVARHADLSAGISLAAGFSAAAGVMVWTLPETRGRQIDS